MEKKLLVRLFSGGNMKIKFLTVVSLMVVLFLGACGGKSDADLQTASDKAIKGDNTTSSVTVAVKDGVATITGEVKDAAAKAKAESLAKVEGVKSVKNDLTVTPPPTAKTDPALKAKIEEALKKKGFDKLEIDTSTTPATMRGTYPKGKLAEAMQTAMVANGGKPVKNEATEAK